MEMVVDFRKQQVSRYALLKINRKLWRRSPVSNICTSLRTSPGPLTPSTQIHIEALLPLTAVLLCRTPTSGQWGWGPKISWETLHPNNGLFRLLKSGRCLCRHMTKTERLMRSFYPQAIWILHFKISTHMKTFAILHTLSVCSCHCHFHLHTRSLYM